MGKISVLIHNANTLKFVQKSLTCLLIQNIKFQIDIWVVNKTRNKAIKKVVDECSKMIPTIKYVTSEEKVPLDYDYFFILDEAVLLRENSISVGLSYLLREKNIGVAFRMFKLSKKETEKSIGFCCNNIDNILTVMDLSEHNKDMNITREIDFFCFSKETCDKFKVSKLKERFKKISVINPHMLCFKLNKGK